MSEDASVQVEEHKGFWNHWSSYRLSLRQTWRELKLPTRSSINWMIDIFAGTSTDHKADFTFCLNAGFYFNIFNMALVYAVLYPVLIALRYLQAKTTPVSNADLKEGDELEGTEWYIKANVGFAEAVRGMATDNLMILCGLVFNYGLLVLVNDYFGGYLLYSGVLMSKNRCVACCLYVNFMLELIMLFLIAAGMVVGRFDFISRLVDIEGDLKSVLSKDNPISWNSCSPFSPPSWNSCSKAHYVLSEALYAKWTDFLLDLMMIKSAFHIRFNTEEATSETESLLQYKHEV